MNPKDLPSEVFDWLSSTNYEDLSHEQKGLVTSFLTPQEYQELRHTVRLFQSGNEAMNIEHPAPSFFDKKNPGLHYKIWKSSVPVHQVSIAVILVAVLFLGVGIIWGKSMAQIPEKSGRAKPVGVTLEQENYPEQLIFDL